MGHLTKITSKAVVGGPLKTKAQLPGLITSKGEVQDNLSVKVSIVSKKINGKAVIGIGIESKSRVINSGINIAPCPIILCVDGGNAFTTVYPPVNGLLNGGTA